MSSCASCIAHCKLHTIVGRLPSFRLPRIVSISSSSSSTVGSSSGSGSGSGSGVSHRMLADLCTETARERVRACVERGGCWIQVM